MKGAHGGTRPHWVKTTMRFAVSDKQPKKVHEQVKMCEFGVLFNDACPHRHYDYDNTLERSCIRIYVHKYIYISKVLNVFHWKHHFKMCTRCANMTYVRSNKNIGFQIGKWNTNFWKLDTKKMMDLFRGHISQSLPATACWRYDMETLSGLWTLCEGNSSVIGGFFSQRVSDAEFPCFLWCCFNKLLNMRSSCSDLSDTYVMSL